MVKKRFLKWVRIVFTISITACVLSFPLAPEGKQLDSDVLDFSLSTIDGEKVCLKDYRGKKMVHLLFWATWCPKCLLEMPKIKKLHDAIGERPYEILTVNVGYNDSPERIRKIKERYQIPCKILFDNGGKVSQGCGVMYVPRHIIIDKDGRVKDSFSELPEDPVKYLDQLFPQQNNLKAVK